MCTEILVVKPVQGLLRLAKQFTSIINHISTLHMASIMLNGKTTRYIFPNYKRKGAIFFHKFYPVIHFLRRLVSRYFRLVRQLQNHIRWLQHLILQKSLAMAPFCINFLMVQPKHPINGRGTLAVNDMCDAPFGGCSSSSLLS